MIEKFPVAIDSNKLEAQDFTLYSKSFEDILKRSIPTAAGVQFFNSIVNFKAETESKTDFEKLSEAFQDISEMQLQFAIVGNILMLGFAVTSKNVIIAVVQGTDSLFLQRAGEDWLLDVRDGARREFLLLKQARTDGLTGMLNLTNLSFLLEQNAASDDMQLVLVELPSPRNTYQQIYRHIIRCASLLKLFLPVHIQIHYLGQSTFGLLFLQTKEPGISEIESNLVAYLKKEGCRKIHVGSSVWRSEVTSENSTRDGTSLLDEAWTALRCAQKRGAFSFCEYHHLAFPEAHPLALPDSYLVRRLGRIWAKYVRFSLVLFRSDNDDDITGLICSEIEDNPTVCSGKDVYVVVDDNDTSAVRIWAEEIVARLEKKQRSLSVSSGISSYPYGNFKKSEMVMNCRKALLHAEFFGPASVVAFDPVSLNISGDVFFNDGDFTGAIREYRRGLLCEANVNLYNSLGVTLAMMGRMNQALDSFTAALDLENDNFMALYNLGLVHQEKNELHKACHYLGKAIKLSSQERIEPEIVNDLKLQLGIISADVGQYQQALSNLRSWLETNAKMPRAAKVYYSIGRAHYGLGEIKDSMSMLQKALVYDEFDDKSMSLLGKIYLEEKQGLEIALSLCLKSVDLEPDNLQHRVYLAEVLIACENFSEAKHHLQRCLRNKKVRGQSQYLMGRGYESCGQQKRASNWYTKVIESGDADKKTRALARKRLSFCTAKSKRGK